MTIHNKFGQQLAEGSVVGWGHRDGNLSVQQIGVIVTLTPYEAKRWDQSIQLMVPITKHKAKCLWVAGSRKDPYISTTEAEDLFALNLATLDNEIIAKVTEALKETA